MAQDGFLVVSSNFKEFEKKFLDVGGTLQTLADIAEAGAQDALAEAIKEAPADTGTMGRNFSLEKRPQLGEVYALKNNLDYAPYVEFGTGENVDVPTELKTYALQFKGKKKIVGQNARAFMYPSALLGQSQILENVKKFIKSKFE